MDQLGRAPFGCDVAVGHGQPDDVLSAVPGLRLLSWVSALDTDGYDRLPTGLRVVAAVMRVVPGMRYMSQYHRYSWG